jgi:hypothetical protein
MKRFPVALSLVALVFSLTPGSVRADDDELKETRIVIRISREFLRRHLNPTVDSTRPVDRMLFGAHVTGTSETHGKTTIDLQAHQDGADFTLRFSGETVNRTVATRSPVRVYSTGRTTFDATRIVRFDGVRFTAEPSRVESAHGSTTDQICVPGGLRGRIAYRRASEQVARNKPRADAIALSENCELVMARFDDETDKFVKELNGIVPLERTVALFVPKARDYVNHLETTPDYLLASPGPKDAVIPVLPKESLRLKAPVEIWLKGRPEGERQRKTLEMWSTLNSGLNRFRSTLKGEEAKVEGLKFTAVGDWWVIKVGEDLVADWLEKKLEKPADAN